MAVPLGRLPENPVRVSRPSLDAELAEHGADDLTLAESEGNGVELVTREPAELQCLSTWLWLASDLGSIGQSDRVLARIEQLTCLCLAEVLGNEVRLWRGEFI